MDTTDITEIDICPPILILILWYPCHRYISMSCFSQSTLLKNTADILTLARRIIPILNTTLSTLNSMVIFTCSLLFSNILRVMPFARWIPTKNSRNYISKSHQYAAFNMFNIERSLFSTSENFNYLGYIIEPWKSIKNMINLFLYFPK